MPIIFLLLFFFTMPSGLAYAIENKECQECHGTQDILKMSADEKSGMVAPVQPKKPVKKAKFSLFLDSKKFGLSVHGQLNCTDCHYDIREVPHPQHLEAVSCTRCHTRATKQYAGSDHAKGSGTLCSDCHNPHEAIYYKRLTLGERSAICLKCHEKGSHGWLPERELHFSSLECAVCHAHGAKTDFFLFFSPAKRAPLTYEQIRDALHKDGEDIKKMLDVNENKGIEINEVKGFLSLLEKGGIKSPRLAGDGLIVEADHAFTGKVTQAKDCTLCHSPKSTFYTSVMLKVPSKSGWDTFPVDREVVAKTPVLPAKQNYFTTVHAKHGVKCIECHAYQSVIREASHFKVKEMKELVCGTRCHKDIMNEYKASVHYKVHEHFCLDCHEPHPNVPYAQLDTAQRRAICLKCHKDTEKQHKWQAQQTLHCKFVECTMCHSPKAEKGIVMYLRGMTYSGREKRLDNKDITELIGRPTQDLFKLTDADNSKALDEREVTAFLKSLNNRKVLDEKGFRNVDLGVNLLVLRPFHNFTEKLSKAKDCSLCHSSEAQGLASLVLQMPGPEDQVISVPVKKEAVLLLLPLPGLGNFYLLGEKKFLQEDPSLLWKGHPLTFIAALGYKWLDIVGFLFILGAVGFVGVHGFIRVATRPVRRKRKEKGHKNEP